MRTTTSFAVACAMLLAGCAQFSFDAKERDLSGREHRYNAALLTLEDGSTRADLERLFPCVRPRPFTPIFSVDGVFNFPPEKHPVDSDFVISVSYRYAHPVLGKLPRGRHTERTTRDKVAMKQFGTRSKAYGIDVRAIDALLFGPRSSPLIHPSASDRIENLPLRVERLQQRPSTTL